MQSRWDSLSSILLQQQVKTSIDPIIARHKYYIQAKANMLKSVSDYFFTAANKDNFVELKTFLAGHSEAEPVNMQLLTIEFDNLDHFTQVINDSGLGLELNGDFFEFIYTEGMRSDTIEFMKKLSLALSACRVCIGMELIYRILLADPHIQTQEYEQYPKQVKELTQSYNLGPNQDDDYVVYLKTYYQNALAMQKKVQDLRAEVNAGKEPFAELIQRTVAVVCTALQETVSKLIKGTTEFQDKTWLGDGWNKFVVGLISEFVARYYHYAYWVSGSLSLNPEYPALLSNELAAFSLTMQDKMALLKLSFLDEAATELEGLIRTVQNEAAIRRIPLIEERQQLYSSGSRELLFKQGAGSSKEIQDYYPPYPGYSSVFQ